MAEKCKFHPITPSPRCRACKSLSPNETNNTPIDAQLKKPESRHGLMPIWGDKNTWNISSLMRKNVFASAYFNKELFNLRDLSSVLEEVHKHVQSIEPWIKGSCNTPSSLFCILVKLFILKLTEGQLRFILDSPSPFVKTVGVLYIRFLAEPSELWDRLKDLTLCSDPIPGSLLSVSELVYQVLSAQDYHSLQLPRIPVKIQALIGKKLSEVPSRNARFLQNLQKSFDKDSTVYLYLEDPVPVIFKAKDGQKVHVQLNGKDLHVHLSDIDDTYRSSQALVSSAPKVFAENRSEYSKRNTSYTENLIFKVPSFRPRSRSRSNSPKALVQHPAPRPRPELQKVSVSSTVQSSLEDPSEYFKLG